MARKSPYDNLSVEERTKLYKKLLKDEMIRLGLDKVTSQTEYQKRYDRKRAVNATTVMKYTGMSWKELVQDLGFEWQRKVKPDEERKVKKEKKRFDFNDEKAVEELLNKIMEWLHEDKNITKEKFLKHAKEKVGVGRAGLESHGYNWTFLKKEYNKRYKTNRFHVVERAPQYKWKIRDLVKALIEEFEKNNYTNMTDYEMHHERDGSLPSVTSLRIRFTDEEYKFLQRILYNLDD